MTDISFPEHSMSGIALDYANLMSQYFESPKPFWYFSFLTCLGHLTSETVILDGSLKTQPRLYMIMLGSSGVSHKSWAGEYTYKFFRELFNSSFPICTGVNSDSGLKNVLAKNSSVLLWFDEFQTFIKKASISGSSLLQHVNELYESNRSEVQKEQKTQIIDPGYLSLLAACTKETYEKVYTPEFLAIGFTNRLWIVPAERTKKVSIPRNIPESQLDPIRERLMSIHARCKTGRIVTMTINSLDEYDSWYMELAESEYATRLDGYAQRLLVLCALSDGSMEVNRDTVRQVAELCNWQLKVRRHYAPYDADNQLAELEQKIMRHCTIYTPTERELKVAIRVQKYGFGLYGKAIDNLIKYDMITRVPEGKTSRLHIVN